MLLLVSITFVIMSVSLSGGDDHHRGVHSGCVCVPHELQSQEPGTSGEPRGLELVLLMLWGHKFICIVALWGLAFRDKS